MYPLLSSWHAVSRASELHRQLFDRQTVPTQLYDPIHHSIALGVRPTFYSLGCDREAFKLGPTPTDPGPARTRSGGRYVEQHRGRQPSGETRAGSLMQQ